MRDIIKPPAPNSATQQRWDQSAKRRRLIEGQWDYDLEQLLANMLDPDRREAWGPRDMSANPFEQITREMSVLYNETPSVDHPNQDVDALTGPNGYITRSGLWSMMQYVQQMVVGLRESFVRIDIDLPNPNNPIFATEIKYRLVTPDLVYCEAHSDNPDLPIYYREYRIRKNISTGEYDWVADVIDLRDPANPIFGMYMVDGQHLGADISEDYIGRPAMIGEEFPYRDSQGRPFIPVVLYHAQKTGKLFDAFYGRQAVEGSLNCAALYSMWTHLMRDACWAQKYIAGLGVAGLDVNNVSDKSRRTSIATDPSSILVFYQDPDATGQAMVGTFDVPVDPKGLLESIGQYEARVALNLGVSASDITRSSGDPRSGYALSISKSGQRDAQRRLSPVFRYSDQELVAKTAMLCNRYLGTNLPEDGYRVDYQSIPLTPEEMRAQREDIAGYLDIGLYSPVDAVLKMQPTWSREQAIQYLDRVRVERSQFNL